MRVVMTLLVRDEEDVLDDHLRFHFAQGVDLVVATDNLSVDATPDILDEHARAGRLVWRRETDDDYAQSAWVTRMAREAATDHGAHWVVNSDADEFWVAASGTLATHLAALPAEVGGIEVARTNFVAVDDPHAPGDPRPFHQRMTVRETRSVNDRGRPILPKIAHRAHPDVVVGQGNHRVQAEGLGEVVAAQGLEILHVPMRSYAQFENKIAKGGRAYANNPDRDRYGRVWQSLYERYRHGTLPDYYADLVPSAEEVAQGLADGRYVEDTRLRDFFAGPPPAARRRWWRRGRR